MSATRTSESTLIPIPARISRERRRTDTAGRPAGLGHYAPGQITLELRGRKVDPFGGLEEVLRVSPELLPCPADALESVYSRPVELGADRAPPLSVIAHLAMLGVRSGRRPRPGFFCQPIPTPDALQ